MLIHISCMCVIFSNVSFHMCSQIASLNRCKVTIVADVQNFSSMISKSPSWTDLKSHKLQMCEIFPIWFSNAFSNRLLEQMQSHISCMWVIFWNVRMWHSLLCDARRWSRPQCRQHQPSTRARECRCQFSLCLRICTLCLPNESITNQPSTENQTEKNFGYLEQHAPLPELQ